MSEPMEELSLHILDVAENTVRAGARRVAMYGDVTQSKAPKILNPYEDEPLEAEQEKQAA